MKYFAILVGSCLALSGCVIETSTSGTAGSGGTAGTAGAGVGASGGSGGSGGSTGGTTSSGGSGGTGGSACVGCGEFVTTGEGTLCDASQALYDDLVACVCTGACMDVCTDNLCAGGDITADCQTCVGDTVAGCGNEFNTCANDI
ncbi:MAG: hypothetical protein IPK82_15755 [Polyangiaceae bacterium]|nr:hypothetical protein [Polyangiaceae bacterium]